MKRSHLDALCAAGCMPELWTLTAGNGSTPLAMKQWVEQALADAAHGTALPFVIVDRQSGDVIGSSRFGNLAHKDRRIEIGWTWVTPAWQRRGVNRETQYLMLRHAFETWHLLRVEFKTDARNQAARAALANFGAVEEGTLRKHMATWTGRQRDTVFYSILDSEWPALKAALEAALA
jgi:RimJ/RimL family protein N-acetyltransferase